MVSLMRQITLYIYNNTKQIYPQFFIMNHDNEYHSTINYGNQFPSDWYFNSDKDALLNDKQEEQSRQYCYKPYRTIHNY